MSDPTGSTSADDGKNTGQPAAAATPPAPAEEKKFSQADFDAAIKERLERERKTASEKHQKDKDAAAEQERIKAGESQAVAEERLTKLQAAEAERDRLKTDHAALVEVVKKENQARMKALPEELRAMIPDGDDVTAQRELIIKAEAAAAKLGISRAPGTPPGPRGSGAPNGTPPAEAAAAKKRAGGQYSM